MNVGNATRRLLVASVALTILGKVGAFLKDILIASSFGASSATDAYFIACLIPLLGWACFYATISNVILPLYLREKAAGNGAAQQFAVEVVRLYGMLGLILALLCAVFVDYLVALLAPAASYETRKLASELALIMSIGFVFTGYVGVQNVLQQAHKQFLFPLLVPVVNHFVAIVFVVFAWVFGNIYLVACGAIAGYFLQAGLQRNQTKGIYVCEHGVRVRLDTVRRIFFASVPVMLAVWFDQIALVIGTSFAANFEIGGISAYNYALRLCVFSSSIFSWLISYFLYPALAENAVNDDLEANRDCVFRGILLISVLTGPLAMCGVFMRTEIVELIYGRGALDADGISAITSMFGVLSAGVLFSCMREFTNRIFFSYQKTWIPLWIGILAAFANFGATWYFSSKMGLLGVAIGATFGAGFYTVVQFLTLAKWKPGLFSWRYVKICGVVGVAAGVGGLVGGEMRAVIGEWPYFLYFVALTVCALLTYGVVLFYLMRLVGIDVLSVSYLQGRIKG